jgi:hypothetical protein
MAYKIPNETWDRRSQRNETPGLMSWVACLATWFVCIGILLSVVCFLLGEAD